MKILKIKTYQNVFSAVHKQEYGGFDLFSKYVANSPLYCKLISFKKHSTRNNLLINCNFYNFIEKKTR